MSDFVAKPKPVDKEELAIAKQSVEVPKLLIAERAKGAHNENAIPDEKFPKDKFVVFSENIRLLKTLIDETTFKNNYC